MMKAVYILLMFSCSFVVPASAFVKLTPYRFEQIDSLQKAGKRNVVVFLHTDWCKFCRAMENTTLKDSALVQLLNTQFYFIPLDAEEKRDILFGGRTFRHQPSGANTGIHELAAELEPGGGQSSYPGLIIMNPRYEIIFRHNQFLSAAELLRLLQQVADASNPQ